MKRTGLNSPCYVRKGTSSNILVLLNFSRISDNEQSHWLHNEDLRKALADLPNIADQLQRVLPLICHHAVKLKIFDDLPSPIKSILKNGSATAIADNMAKRQWLQQAITHFSANNIPVILLKSAAFSGTLYPNDSPRPGNDIDLLVKQQDFTAASQLLEKSMALKAHNTWERNIPVHTYEQSFIPTSGIGPAIDLHHDLTTPFLFNIDEQTLWRDSQIHPVYQNEFARILCPEDSLLHQAVHAYKDFNFCKYNLVDSHEVICQWQPSPDLLLDKATQWGAKHLLYCLLENCQTVMSSPVSAHLKTELAPSRLKGYLGKRILRSNYSKLTTQKNIPFRCMQIVSQFVLPDKLSNVLRYQSSYALNRIYSHF
ncbi:MAG: nucleotidyltransferase family protein [Flavobacteriales bacterium]|nr:nucleotidyltransferase family protein [Flavobacteriales bacterium]